MAITNRNRLLEKYVQVVREDGLNTNKNVNIGVAAGGSTATLSVGSGGISSTGVISGSGGQTQAGSVQTTVFHSGQVAPFSGVAATSGATNVTAVTTDTYVAEVFVPDNATLTGVSVLNGTAVAGNIFVGLANAGGTVVAKSATNVAGSGTSTYQQIPFTTTYAAVGPAKYFILAQFSNTGARFNAHTIGNFGAVAVTSETYGTFQTTAAYATTTFTTAVGPVADTY